MSCHSANYVLNVKKKKTLSVGKYEKAEIFFNALIYLAVLGLNCGMWDLSLQCTDSSYNT